MNITWALKILQLFLEQVFLKIFLIQSSYLRLFLNDERKALFVEMRSLRIAYSLQLDISREEKINAN